MNLINRKVMESLKEVEVPISFQKYNGKKEEYITFHVYRVDGEEYEDDKEVLIGYYIQIDIWNKRDYTELVEKVKEEMQKNNFKRIAEVDLYEEDTKIYHKGLKFYYLEEKEME